MQKHSKQLTHHHKPAAEKSAVKEVQKNVDEIKKRKRVKSVENRAKHKNAKENLKNAKHENVNFRKLCVYYIDE